MDAFLTADFRRAVRGHLAERPAVAQAAEVIHRHLRREFDCTVEETANALVFCESLKHVAFNYDEMGGSTKFYRITAAGILAHERSE